MKRELKKKRASGTDIILSDPRPSNQRHTEISKEEKNSFVSDLWRIGGDSGWTTLIDYEYDDFSLDDYGVDVLKEQCKQFQEFSNLHARGKRILLWQTTPSVKQNLKCGYFKDNAELLPLIARMLSVLKMDILD